MITSYPEYNTVVIKVREGETTEVAENRHLTNIRRINQVLTAKYAELKETAQLVKSCTTSSWWRYRCSAIRNYKFCREYFGTE